MNTMYFQKIYIEDRVAFSCMYLPDIALNTYINSISNDLINNGRLEGIAIIGLCTKSGISLLQSYIDQVSPFGQSICIIGDCGISNVDAGSNYFFVIF